jgi:hypothetical protein
LASVEAVPLSLHRFPQDLPACGTADPTMALSCARYQLGENIGSALLRAGSLDRQVLVGHRQPGSEHDIEGAPKKGRAREDVDREHVAELTLGFTGAGSRRDAASEVRAVRAPDVGNTDGPNVANSIFSAG